VANHANIACMSPTTVSCSPHRPDHDSNVPVLGLGWVGPAGGHPSATPWPAPTNSPKPLARPSKPPPCESFNFNGTTGGGLSDFRFKWRFP
jgi:hypothetical protein